MLHNIFFVYSAAAIAVLITLDNWSRWGLVEPETQVTCGKQASKLPDAVRPGFSEMVLFEKGVRHIFNFMGKRVKG